MPGRILHRLVPAAPFVALVVALVVSTGVGGASIRAVARPHARTEAPTGAITVFAASSLTEAFTAMGRAFERRHPKTTITFSFGASSALESQIDAGAPADVFASADEGALEQISDSIRGTATIFARNRLMIAVEPGNPLSIRTLADTSDPGVLLVLCAREVPCGALARTSYRRAGVTVPDAAWAENVKAALTTVALGEADAAVVYTTDVRGADRSVEGVRIPKRDNVVARYPIAVLRNGDNPELARAFVEFVLSAPGRQVLSSHGFPVP